MKLTFHIAVVLQEVWFDGDADVLGHVAQLGPQQDALGVVRAALNVEEHVALRVLIVRGEKIEGLPNRTMSFLMRFYYFRVF